MPRVFIDFETFSRCDLRKHGLDRYARHESTEALMLAYAFDSEPVEIVSFAEGERAPRRLREALRDPTVLISAYNAAFERAILHHVLHLDLPPERFRDTMALANALTLPGSLGRACDAVDLPQDKKKDSRGKALIRLFSMPRKPTKNKPYERATWVTDPDEWAEFKSYCMQDVEAERALYRRLRKWDLTDEEWGVWALNERINTSGIPVNLRAVDNAVRVAGEITTARLQELREITHVANPNSTAQLLPWLQEHGYPYHDLKKAHVHRAAEEATGILKRVLDIRKEVSKASVKKFSAYQDRVGPDGVLRGSFRYAGAGRTGRFSSAGGVQMHNPPRPHPALEKTQLGCVRDLEFLDAEAIELIYPEPMELLSTCVRPVVQAPKGHLLVDADLSAIENRVLGWVADEDKILQVFRDGQDPYLAFAVHMTGRSYESLYYEYKTLKNKKNRTLAKPGTLGCGFRLGPGEVKEDPKTNELIRTGLVGYAWNMGVPLTLDEATEVVRIWRETFQNVVQYWYTIEDAAKRCVRTGRPQPAGHCEFDRSGPFLRLRLPSGRYLHYLRPKIEAKRTPWGAMRDNITYEGLNNANQWVRLSTQGGKLVENLVQGMARDLLVHGMRLADKEGLRIAMHLHDQLVAISPEDKADEHLRILRECMSDTPRWAKGLPLAAEGFTSPVFLKD